MKDKKLVVANLKMYMNTEEVSAYLKTISEIHNPNVVICPTNIYLPYFTRHDFSVGIQNVAATNLGAYTGEVSALQAKELGVNYAIVGHSERRQYFNETDEIISEKIKRCLEAGIQPILCIGETKEEYECEQTVKVLKKQLLNICSSLTSEQVKSIIYAYEPVWAIGTGITPTNETITQVSAEIKKMIIDNFQVPIRLLYGGSINENNIAQLEQITNIDGYLVGKAAVTEEFIRLLKVVY